MSPDIFVLTTTDPGSDTQAIQALRDTATAQHYQCWSCENFMECVIPSADWKLKSRKQKLSKYVTTALEAFVVLVYHNSFDVWNQCWIVDTSASTNVSEENNHVMILSGANTFRFTGESKGSRKYKKGWNSAAGMEFYNKLLGLVGIQRDKPGCTFERGLLTALATKPPRTGRANDTKTQPPKARKQPYEWIDANCWSLE
jgi:hypothetical protein